MDSNLYFLKSFFSFFLYFGLWLTLRILWILFFCSWLRISKGLIRVLIVSLLFIMVISWSCLIGSLFALFIWALPSLWFWTLVIRRIGSRVIINFIVTLSIIISYSLIFCCCCCYNCTVTLLICCYFSCLWCFCRYRDSWKFSFL